MPKPALTKAQLTEIETNAAAQLTVFETATLLDLDEALLSEGPGALAYLRGQIRAKAVAQQALFREAKEGNTQALKQYVEICQRNQAVVEK